MSDNLWGNILGYKVGAMILHAASIAAFFVDQLAQASVQIQCVQQSTPESWVKWLLPTIVQTVVSLASITAGVMIALWSFRVTSKRDREQWLRDQKKAEWQELLRAATQMRRVVSIGSENPLTRAQLIRAGLKSAVLELEATAASSVFLNDFFGDGVKGERFYSYIREADLDVEGINALFEQIQHLKHPNPEQTDREREGGVVRTELQAGNQAAKIANDIIGLNDWLRREAATSLETTNDQSGKASTTPSSESTRSK